MEIWKEITGYEGYYEVSNLGNVRSLDRYVYRPDGVIQLRKGRIKAQTMTPDGYMTVSLNKDGINRKERVHRLVAENFVEGFFEGSVIDHLDGDRTNNRFDNLEWVTQTENVKRSIDIGSHVSCWADYTGENNPNYHNDTLRKRYAEDKEFALEKQSRPGGRNGRAVKTSVMHDDTTKTFDTMTLAAEYVLNSLGLGYKPGNLAAKIPAMVKENKDYLGYYFAFV